MVVVEIHDSRNPIHGIGTYGNNQDQQKKSSSAFEGPELDLGGRWRMAPFGDRPADRSALRLRRARGDVLQRRLALLANQNPRKLIDNYVLADAARRDPSDRIKICLDGRKDLVEITKTVTRSTTRNHF